MKDYLKQYLFSGVYCLTWFGDLQRKVASSGPFCDYHWGGCCYREERNGPEGRSFSVIFIYLVIFVLLWKLLGRLKILSLFLHSVVPISLGNPQFFT